MKQLTESLWLERHDDGVHILFIDVPGESVNTLKKSFAEEFESALKHIERSNDSIALALASRKDESFVVGADIKMLGESAPSEVFSNLSRIGQAAVQRLETFVVPVVAAIDGPCLGGGLELALACAGRVASSNEKTRLGLPEVQLGILPGMGGTQRLAPLVGLEAALDLLLTGKQIPATKAMALGLVDEVVPHSIVVEVARKHALRLAHDRKQKRSAFTVVRDFLVHEDLKDLLLAENPIGRKVVFDQAAKRLREKTEGHYPAPEKILDVVRHGLERGRAAGLEEEAQAFGELVTSPVSQALRHVFFAQQQTKKNPTDATVPERIGVIGAGLMGAGIALVTVDTADIPVRLRDVRLENLQAGLRTIQEALEEKVSRKRLSNREATKKLNMVTRTSGDDGFDSLDLVIEAVFEDLALKRAILGEVERKSAGRTIFASNTSSLPISVIAAEASHPENVIGMHYFSPVPKMPLLEVVRTAKTNQAVVDRVVELGRKQGKTVIVVGDGAGFYTTRILGPYLNEAARAVTEGYAVDDVDRALKNLGFPVGPLALLDEIGIDVGSKVVTILERAFGERMRPPDELLNLPTKGRLGRKVKKGFYLYGEERKKGAKRPVDEDVYAELGAPKRREASREELTTLGERCLMMMINEAIHCLEAGILARPGDGDVGAIFGLGFPPYLGGPFHFADSIGSPALVERLRSLQLRFGARFEPAPLLRRMAENNETFRSQERVSK